MKKIIVITYGYPNRATSTLCTFLEDLVTQWEKMGIEVHVINPLTLKNYLICRKDKDDRKIFPFYCDYRILKVVPFLRKYSYKLADVSFEHAVEEAIGTLKMDNSVVLYAHFLNAGYIAGKLSEKTGIKSFCAFGESDLWSIKGKKTNDLKRSLGYISGFISVSTNNTEVLKKMGIAEEEKILFAPNGVNLSSFSRQDKIECRKKLGFPTNEKIGIFVGHFIDRKGPLRVEEATKGIPNLKMIYVGSGPQRPSNKNILFCGKINHDQLQYYLGAADFFVLPTKAEGCCNSIIEAIACGLPIISSNRAFNDDILKPEYSIRIDPEDINGIRKGIESIINNKTKAEKMSKAAIIASVQFDIIVRAKKIADFIST